MLICTPSRGDLFDAWRINVIKTSTSAFEISHPDSQDFSASIVDGTTCEQESDESELDMSLDGSKERKVLEGCKAHVIELSAGHVVAEDVNLIPTKGDPNMTVNNSIWIHDKSQRGDHFTHGSLHVSELVNHSAAGGYLLQTRASGIFSEFPPFSPLGSSRVIVSVSCDQRIKELSEWIYGKGF